MGNAPGIRGKRSWHSWETLLPFMFQTLADRQLGSCKLRVFQQEGDFVFVRVIRIASQKQEPQGTRSELML